MKESRTRRPARSVRPSGSTWSIDEAVAIPTIRAALDLGITPIVAALAYGCDRSEEPVGSALTESRGCICIAPGS